MIQVLARKMVARYFFSPFHACKMALYALAISFLSALRSKKAEFLFTFSNRTLLGQWQREGNTGEVVSYAGDISLSPFLPLFTIGFFCGFRAILLTGFE